MVNGVDSMYTGLAIGGPEAGNMVASIYDTYKVRDDWGKEFQYKWAVGIRTASGGQVDLWIPEDKVDGTMDWAINEILSGYIALCRMEASKTS